MGKSFKEIREGYFAGSAVRVADFAFISDLEAHSAASITRVGSQNECLYETSRLFNAV